MDIKHHVYFLPASAFGKPWIATDDAAVATDEFFLFFFTFLLFSDEHGVKADKRSQSIQSVRHSKQTRWMLPTHVTKTVVREKGVFLAHSAQLAVQ